MKVVKIFKTRTVIFAFILALALIGGIFAQTSKAIAAETLGGLGTLNSSESFDLYDGRASETNLITKNTYDQRVFTVDFNPKTDVVPEVAYGATVYKTNYLTKIVEHAESSAGGSKTVIAALNGDYFDMADGITFGMAIVNGKYINNTTEVGGDAGIDANTNLRTLAAFGFKADGTVVYGIPQIETVFKVNDGVETGISQVNRRRKDDNYWQDIRLLTPEFYSSTQSQDYKGTGLDFAGKDVILTINPDDVAKGLHIGGTVRTTVKEIINTSTTKATTPIASNNMVLTTHSQKLNGINVGDEIEIKVTDKENKWNDVVNAMGAYRILADNGVGVAPYTTRTAVAPRSAFGIKADGTCVFLEADGRQTLARGLSYKNIIEYLLEEKDCKTIIELDGGGSSAIMTRREEDTKAYLRNTPSDPSMELEGEHGKERGLSVAWILVPRTITHTVKFIASIDTTHEFTVPNGAKFTDLHTIPAVPEKVGYTGAWNAEKLALLDNVTQDITLTVTYTAVSSENKKEDDKKSNCFGFTVPTSFDIGTGIMIATGIMATAAAMLILHRRGKKKYAD